MIEIYLDDYHLHSLSVPGLPTKVDRGVEGLESPEQRVDAYNNPGGDGQTIANILHGGRLVTLEGRIRGNDVSTYRASRAVFHQLIGGNRGSLGQLIPRVLKLVDATGAEYRLNCVVRSLKNPDDMPASSKWQMQLQATDFRIYSEAEGSSTLFLPISGGILIPFTFPATFGQSSGGSGVITNAGTLSTPPVVVFHGPMENPKLTNDTTGQSMQLNLILVAGDEVTVDMAARTIIQGSNTNRMAAKTNDSKFWLLEPGVNSLSLSATGYDTGFASITYRSAYLGL